jgi:RNA polymerase sigma factor (sigma-70 family)
MDTTRTTLLERVRDPGDARAWAEFHRLYSRLIYHHARSRGLNDTEASEILGDCMERLAREMRGFRYDKQKGRFRAWLRAVATNRITDHLRRRRVFPAAGVGLDELPGPQEDGGELWDRQWRAHHALHCWKHIAPDLPPLHSQAFHFCVLEGLPPAEVAKRLGLRVNHVYQIKARITARLKTAMRELLGEDDGRLFL